VLEELLAVVSFFDRKATLRFH